MGNRRNLALSSYLAAFPIVTYVHYNLAECAAKSEKNFWEFFSPSCVGPIALHPTTYPALSMAAPAGRALGLPAPREK